MFNGILTTKPVTRVVNLIIHHNEISITRFNYELSLSKNPIGSPDFDVEQLLHKNVKSFSPIVEVESDQHKRIIFGIADLIHTFESEVLVPIVEICTEDQLFLTDL